MALSALSLSITTGIQGRPFAAKINGLTTGKVEVLSDGTPGAAFGITNGVLRSEGLPSGSSPITVSLREYEPGGSPSFRDTRVEIVAVSQYALVVQALASLSGGRSLRRFDLGSTRESDGGLAWSLVVENDLGASAAYDPGGGSPTPSPTPTPTPTPVSPLNPMQASQAPAFIWWPTKINSGYSGNALQVRDNTNTVRTVAFAGDNSMNLAAMPTYGDGVTFVANLLYDQSGNARDMSTSTRPRFCFPGATGTLVNVPVIGAGGTGYTVGDVLTVVGGVLATSGGIAAQVTVATAPGGVIATVTVSRAGKYHSSPSITTTTNAATTGGTGTGATLQIVLTADAGNTYANPWIDYGSSASQHLVTTATFLDVGGTANLAAFLVAARLGYAASTFPLARPGTQTPSFSSTLLGFGTLASGVLLTGTTGNDEGRRSAGVYSKPNELMLDEDVPSGSISDMESLWFNQSGATVTGGSAGTTHWQNRAHNVTSATSQRLTLGCAGSLGNSANAAVRGLIVYQGAQPLTDTESARIAQWQYEALGLTHTATVGNRYAGLPSGQSNIASQLSDPLSGDGTTGTASFQRRFLTKLAERLGIETWRITIIPAGSVGGTPMMMRPMPGDAAAQMYWWDEDANGPGTLARGSLLPNNGGAPIISNAGTGYSTNDVLTVVGGTLAAGGSATQLRVTSVSGGTITGVTVTQTGLYSVAPTNPVTVTGGSGTGATFTGAFTVSIISYVAANPALKLKKLFIVHGQGEDDATGALTDARILTWDAQTYLLLDYYRTTVFGQPNAPIIKQPLAKFGAFAVSAQVTRVNKMRRRQTAMQAGQTNLFIAPDTGHIARGTAGNYDAHFGSLLSTGQYAYDASTGGPEDGYQRAAWQDALAAAHAINVVYGAPLAQTDVWRGPEASAAQLVSTGTIDVTISYPTGSGGTDFTSISGTYDGTPWRVTSADGNTTRTITAASKTGGKVRLSVTGATVGDIVYYEPNYAQRVTGDPMTHLRDNYATLPLPVATSQPLTVSA